MDNRYSLANHLGSGAEIQKKKKERLTVAFGCSLAPRFLCSVHESSDRCIKINLCFFLTFSTLTIF